MPAPRAISIVEAARNPCSANTGMAASTSASRRSSAVERVRVAVRGTISRCEYALTHGRCQGARSDQAEARRVRGGGGAGGQAKLRADVGDMPVHRVRAEHELLGDLPIAEADGDELQDL